MFTVYYGMNKYLKKSGNGHGHVVFTYMYLNNLLVREILYCNDEPKNLIHLYVLAYPY